MSSVKKASPILQTQYEVLVDMLRETHGIHFDNVAVFRNGQPIVGCDRGLYFLTTTVLPLKPKTMLMVTCEQYDELREGVLIDYDELMRRARILRTPGRSSPFIVNELLLDTHERVAAQLDYIIVRGEEAGVYQVVHPGNPNVHHKVSASILMEEYLNRQPGEDTQSLPEDFRLTFEELDDFLKHQARAHRLKPNVYLSMLRDIQSAMVMLRDIQSAMVTLHENQKPGIDLRDWLRKESFKQILAIVLSAVD